MQTSMPLNDCLNVNVELTGPQGPQGPQGPKGERGETGPQGPAGVIEDGSVTTAKLANLAVTNDKLADLAVTTDKLDIDAVTTAKLADGAVALGKIANDAVRTIRSIGLVAANSQTDQALTLLGFPHTTRTPKEMGLYGEYDNSTLRLCWISGTTLEVAPIALFGNLQTQEITLYAKGFSSLAGGRLGVDDSWVITAN